MLNKFLDSLSARRWINFLVLLVYFIIAVLPHEQVGIIIADVFRPYTRDIYNNVFVICAGGGLLVYLFVFYTQNTRPLSKLLLSYLVINLVLAVVCFKVLFVLNVESIHFLQYALFAILCFPLLNNYTLTLTYTTIAGAIDEIYQFYYLAPERTEYYDFNDVIINLIGAVFGLILIRSLSKRNYTYTVSEFLRSIHFKIFFGLVLFIVGLFLSGLLVRNYDPQNLTAKFWLIRKQAVGFWQERPRFNFKYHIVQPWEGVFIIGLLILIYSGLYKGTPSLNKVN